MPEIFIVNKRDLSVVIKQFPYPTSCRPVCVSVCVFYCWLCTEVKGFPFFAVGLQPLLMSILPNLHREFIKHTKSGLLCLCKLEYGHHCDTKIVSVVADSLIITIYAQT